MEIIDLSRSTLEEVKNIIDNDDKYILINFYAFWCEPCCMLNPVIEQIANNYSGVINTYRIDVDKNPIIADEYKITNIPTIILQKKDKIVKHIVGYNVYDKLEEELTQAIKVDNNT